MNHFKTFLIDDLKQIFNCLIGPYSDTEISGKHINHDVWIHMSAIETQCFHEIFDIRTLHKVDMSNIVMRYNLDEINISILHYPDFLSIAHPKLCCSLRVDLKTDEVTRRQFNINSNGPILHRKELLVSVYHPQYNQFRQLTEQEEKLGLLVEKSKIGWSKYWDELLRSKNLVIRNHRLMEIGDGPR